MRLNWALALGCGAAAFALNMQTGRIGYMPLDQSIIFDGAWRLLNGQLPWRDFSTPGGLVPIGLQAFLFAVLGVNWWSYVFHAAVLNGAAAVLVFCYLRAAGLPIAPSVSCALATGAWLYPLMGTPYMDQHSLFFAGLAVAGCCHAARTGRRGWWIAAGISAGLAILSKQVPALVMLPVAGVALFAAPRRQAVAGLTLAVAASLATIAVILGTLLTAGARLSDLTEFAWRLPAEVGRERLGRASEHILSATDSLLLAMPLTYWGAIGVVAMTLAVLVSRRFRQGDLTDTRLGELLTPLAVSGGLVATTIVSSALTTNTYELLFGLLPFAAALLLLACLRSIGAGLAPSTPGWVRVVVVTLFCTTMLADAAMGYPEYALSRRCNDLVVTAADRAKVVPVVLRRTGLSAWEVPSRYISAADSFDQLLNWLAQHQGNIFLVGDESIVYGLSGRPSVPPSLWDHPGLTYRTDAAGSRRVSQLLDAAIARYAVRWVVLPMNHGWLTDPDGPYDAVFAAYKGQACEAVGTYRVCELANRVVTEP